MSARVWAEDCTHWPKWGLRARADVTIGCIRRRVDNLASTPSTIAGGYHYHYVAFGLRITSELELPELPRRFDDAEAPHVIIELGVVAPTLSGAQTVEPGISARPGALLIDYAEARFLIQDGARITVQPALGAPERDVRLYLLGSAMGAIFHQRGLLPLHANAIEFDGEIVAFAGPSGAGKSTLAAHFQRRGHQVFSDDVCALAIAADGRPMALPGIPRIKLWGDALQAAGLSLDGLEPVWSGMDKYSLATTLEGDPSPLPLARIYVLEVAPVNTAPVIRRLAGVDVANALINNIYRWPFARALGQSADQFRRAISVGNACPVFSAQREWGHHIFSAQAELLERHLGRGR